MDKLNIIFMLSLPVVFILHDFEEILGMENFKIKAFQNYKCVCQRLPLYYCHLLIKLLCGKN